MAAMFMRLYGGFALLVTVLGLGAMLVTPPRSTRADRDGVPHFTPPVMHPETGEGVRMNKLISHYKGE